MKIELEKDDEDGGWVAVVTEIGGLAITGLASEGDTALEAVTNVLEAKANWQIAMLRRGGNDGRLHN